MNNHITRRLQSDASLVPRSAPLKCAVNVKEEFMRSSKNNVDEAVEETIKSELLDKRYKENLKIQKALKKQEEWLKLIED